MIFGDMFNSFDSSRWDLTDSTGSSDYTDGILTLTGGSSFGYQTLNSDITFADNTILEFRAKLDATYGIAGFRTGTSWAANDMTSFYTQVDAISGNGSGNVQPVITPSITGTYHNFRIDRKPTSVDFIVDGNVEATDSTYYTSTARNVVIAARDEEVNEFDYLFIRKYTAVEPTYTIGVTTAPDKFSAVSDSDGNVSVFDRRKPILMSGLSETSDFEETVTILYEQGMLDNFDDIRFVTAVGINIPYEIMSKTDGITASVNVIFDAISGNNIIHMYYADSNLAEGSDSSLTWGTPDTSAVVGAEQYPRTGVMMIL